MYTRAYHGSSYKGLKELSPFTKKGATICDPCVYMTTDKIHAALYIWDKPFYFFTYGFTSDGRIHYEEYFEDALKYFYKNKSGAIYMCEGDFETAEKTGIKNLVTSCAPVKISESEIVNDVYDYIISAENAGKIKITRYADLSEERIAGIKKQIEMIKNDAATNAEELKFIKEIFG